MKISDPKLNDVQIQTSKAYIKSGEIDSFPPTPPILMSQQMTYCEVTANGKEITAANNLNQIDQKSLEELMQTRRVPVGTEEVSEFNVPANTPGTPPAVDVNKSSVVFTKVNNGQKNDPSQVARRRSVDLQNSSQDRPDAEMTDQRASSQLDHKYHGEILSNNLNNSPM